MAGHSMVVEIQENELGEIVFIERSPEECDSDDNEYCIVDCQVQNPDDPNSNVVETNCENSSNIEIVYLPQYENPSPEPIVLKQEILSDFEDNEINPAFKNYEIVEFCDETKSSHVKDAKPGRKRTFSSSVPFSNKSSNQSASNSIKHKRTANIVLKHQDVFKSKEKPWSMKIETKDFVQTKNISSVTTIHTKSAGMSSSAHGSENNMTPVSKIIVKSENGDRTLAKQLPHKCKHCERSFRQSVSLQIHSTLHSESAPDSCLVS